MFGGHNIRRTTFSAMVSFSTLSEDLDFDIVPLILQFYNFTGHEVFIENLAWSSKNNESFSLWFCIYFSKTFPYILLVQAKNKETFSKNIKRPTSSILEMRLHF